MNERVKDEQLPLRIGPVSSPASESHRSDSYGIGVRIDGAHTYPVESATREVDWPAMEHFVPVRPTEPSVVRSVPEVTRFDTQFLDEVGLRAQQLHLQFQTQKADLDQREQALRARQSVFEDEKHRFSHRVANDQSQLDARKSQLQKSETTLAERFIAFEIQSRKLDADRETQSRQRSELDRQKQSLREEALAELHVERGDFERAKSANREEYDRVELLKRGLEQRLDTLTAENERTLQAERETLWQSLTTEWEQRQAAFQQEREAWVKSRDLEVTELDREKAMFESSVQSANAEFLAARNELALELANVREQQAGQLQAERSEWEQTRDRLDAETRIARDGLQLEILASRERHAATLLAERDAWEHSRRREDAELLTSREALELELIASREQQAAKLAQARDVWEQSRHQEMSLLEAQKVEWLAKCKTLELEFIASRELQATTLAAEREEWEQVRQREMSLQGVQQADQRKSLELEFLALREQQSIRLATEREEWEQTRQLEQSQLDAQRAEQLAACQALEAEFLASRERHTVSLESERDEWEQSRAREQAMLEAQQAEWLASRDSLLSAAREAQELECAALREQHTAIVRAERDEWEQIRQHEKTAFEAKQTELFRERTLIENRIRFQQDHLDKSRFEFERAQNEHRHERQVERQRLEEAGMLMIRRLRQIDLYRSSIDAREKSLDREHEVFNRTRKAISSTADLDRLNFQAERHGWEQERQTQQAELRRQQDALANRAESLESRRTRLDKLRAELEETHRATLEMRLAVEEAWAQLTQVAGQDDARRRVEQVRHALIGYYQQMHETLTEQRREHFEAQSKFERQRAEFTDERQKLTTWFAARDEELRLGEERLRIAAMDASTNHTKWLSARDRWLLEKTEAEHLIRRLLASLGENNRDQSSELESVLPLDEIGTDREAAPSNSASIAIQV